GTVRWWDAATGKRLRSWDARVRRADPKATDRFLGYHNAVLSPDGKVLAAHARWEYDRPKETVAESAALVVLDLDARKELWRSEAVGLREPPVRSSPDGKEVPALELNRSGPAVHVTAMGKWGKRLPMARGGAGDG